MTALFTGDGPTRAALHINAATLWNLPEWSAAPAQLGDQIAALHALGTEGFQHPFPALLPDIPIPIVGMGRVDTDSDAERVAKQDRDAGYLLTTLHVGTGWENDEEAYALLSSVVEASDKHDYPLLVETHRATSTQDMRRTLDVLERVPELRFNADLSHWYTGHEMTYGDMDAKLDRLKPVFERVRYVHGRIGTPCCAQVALNGASDDRIFVEHFREMWRRVCRGFVATSEQGEILPFAPELLPAEAKFGEDTHQFHYARLFDMGDGLKEESDRWRQARTLWEIFSGIAAAEGLPVRG